MIVIFVTTMNNIDSQNEIRRQIESNDPELDKLTIGHNPYRPQSWDYLPPDGDWERDGRGIGNNEHIKELRFERDLPGHLSRDKFEAFCRGFACNKSIEKLVIDCPELFGGEIFNILSPFFEQNVNLRCLWVSFSVRSTSNIARLLAASLSRFKTLIEFHCWGGRHGDNDLGTLIQALAGHSQLTNMGLRGNEVGGRGLAALEASLVNPALAQLDLGHCSLDDERAVILAAALLGRTSALRRLGLSENDNITIVGWRAIFALLQSPHLFLEELDLAQNSIDDDVAILLANALANSTNFKVLDLTEVIGDITIEGWRALFGALQSPRCMLQELNVGSNGLDDGVVSYLANSLSGNGVLRNLDLSFSGNVSPSGWREFSAVLQNPNSALEKLDLKINNSTKDNDLLVSFADSLTRNAKLKELFLDYDKDNTIGWDALSNAMCNNSSIDATFNSNHTLERTIDPDDEIDDESRLPSDLHTLLQLNRENTKIEAARCKILQCHFSGSDISIQPFIDFDLKALPHAIAWMAKDEHGSSLLYTFVQNTTLFVGIGGVTKTGGEPRSKRQKM